ncbi:hypothetical protein [Peribacillus sp. JNUCC41]|uniref:hypothetical protein n=1 Tax=Peribacillus sp. JNUCC41 TaxID=2778370 RepID=UPI0017849167|nr:hypothetical protein [Brevibacillus sp. JNUCC-41]QOS89239.1 hypothetical protein JNUCC41_21130 [Brevibacillus sp. JNUCC-41]
MKSKLHVEEVFVAELTQQDFPVYLLGYDPFTDQNFKGKFVYRDGELLPVSYETSRNKKISTRFVTEAVSYMRRYKEDYEKISN